MAIYRLSATIVKRLDGRSATASAAYRAGIALTDERTGAAWDYTRKSGILHTEILAPEDAPDWMRDRAALWNAVEMGEKRKDAQVAREVQLALPHELTTAQQVELVREFVAEAFIAHGMVADVAIHAPDWESDERNTHAHILLTMREVAGDGFGPKAREWNSEALLQEWREGWERHVNRTLEREGIDARIDHRSLEDQGIDREPTQHLGPAVKEMTERGIPTDRGEAAEAVTAANGERQRIVDELADIGRQMDALERARAIAGHADDIWKRFESGQGPPAREDERQDDRAGEATVGPQPEMPAQKDAPEPDKGQEQREGLEGGLKAYGDGKAAEGTSAKASYLESMKQRAAERAQRDKERRDRDRDDGGRGRDR